MDFRQGLPVGSVVGGDYRIIDVLGQGGFGLTYKGLDTRLGSAVAIKEYFPADMAVREDGTSVRVRSTREEGVFSWGREKFLEEARTLARFRHPNIVRVARLFEENNTAYMVLDFEEGPSLAQWRQGLGRPPRQDELDRIATLLLDAVDVVHRGGILHRDIKPQNVVMRGGNEPVLIDFGAARASLGQRSKTVHAIVTPGYSPKEQYALDVDRQGPWSDIYALGATFYYLVTGNSPPDALTRDLEAAMPMETDGREPYRESFLAAIDVAMQVRSEDRPQSIDEWRPMLFSEAPTAHPRDRRRGPDTSLETVVAAPLPGSGRPQTGRGLPGSRRPQAGHGLPGSGPVRSVTFDEIDTPSSTTTQRGGGALRWLAGAALLAAAAGGFWYHTQVLQPAREEAAWQAALRANTLEAYEAYITEFPNGVRISDARSRRQQLATAARPPAQPQVSPILIPPLPPPTAVTPPAPEAPPTPPPSTPAPPVGPQAQPTPPPSVQPPLTPPEPPARPVTPGTGQTQGRASAPLVPRSLPGPLPETELARLQQTVTNARWRLVSFLGTRIRGYSEQQADFMSELERLSGGRMTVSQISSDDVGGAQNIIRDIRTQSDLIGWHTPSQSAGRRRAYLVLAGGVPFGLAPADHVRWLRADGARLLEQLYARDNFQVRSIPCGIAGSAGGWFRREIRSPNDFRGLKVRATTLASDVLQRLGATPVTFQNNELAAAVAANTLDAVLSQLPLATVFARTPPPVPIYHFPSWHGPSQLFELIMSSAFWNAMTDSQQRLVDEACRRNLDKWATQFESSQTEVLTQIRNARVAVRPFTGPTLEALRKATDEALAEEAGKSADFKEVLDSYNRFRR